MFPDVQTRPCLSGVSVVGTPVQGESCLCDPRTCTEVAIVMLGMEIRFEITMVFLGLFKEFLCCCQVINDVKLAHFKKHIIQRFNR